MIEGLTESQWTRVHLYDAVRDAEKFGGMLILPAEAAAATLALMNADDVAEFDSEQFNGPEYVRISIHKHRR